MGLNRNFTLHKDAINKLGTENWLLVNITGTNEGVIEGGSFPMDNLVFHFEDAGEPVVYELLFNYPRLSPAPTSTVFETFSPENKDDKVTEQFVYYIRVN